jgi:hypothetical protein
MTSFSSSFAADAASVKEELGLRDRTAITGIRNEGLAVSEIAGVAGGILGGVCALSGGSSKGAALVGAAIGALGGYALGTVMGPISNINTTTKVLTGITAASFGVSVASLGAAITDSLCNLAGQ